MTTLEPTGNYCYIQLVPKSDTALILPDGAFNPDSDVIILATGPLVEQLVAGDKVILRPKSNLMCIDEKEATLLVDIGSIMAVIK